MIERATSYRRVKKLADWDLVVSPEFYYLVDVDAGTDAGVWVFCPFKGELIVHASMDREHRGAYAAKSARDAFKWIFEHTGYETIIAEIPGCYRHVHIMARNVGMEFERADNGLRCYKITEKQRAA